VQLQRDSSILRYYAARQVKYWNHNNSAADCSG